MKIMPQRLMLYGMLIAAVSMTLESAGAASSEQPPTPSKRPNIVLILADDMGFSDLGCYGSEIATPNLDRLAENGLRFTQFYNTSRCCPTRAALLTGLYSHQAGVGHMLQNWHPPSYTSGLNNQCATIAELLHLADYRNYHAGKWHVGGLRKGDSTNHPLNRGFDRAYGSGGGGNYFALRPLYLDRETVKAGDDFYATDAFSDWAVRFVREHGREHADRPFFLNLCYTAPHFPLHAKPADIAKYRGRYLSGWDQLREHRYQKQRRLGIIDERWALSPRDPVAQAWESLTDAERDEWDLRMAVYAAMIDCMDQGIGRVLNAIGEIGARENTIVLFLSDNGSSAEFLDTWPNPARGHKPGSVTGTRDSHRCLEVGWANAANTPFREHKMWVHEGGIATPLIVSWPERIKQTGAFTQAVGHVIDVLPTCLELAGVEYPQTFAGRELTPPAGESLVAAFEGETTAPRTLAWEHEGNRAIRIGDWKLVAARERKWELYDLQVDRSETHDLAGDDPHRVAAMSQEWQRWADHVGVVPWNELPTGTYHPSQIYRKKSEPVSP